MKRTPEVPAVLKGDIGRLRQILLNLVGNAIKFTSSGEILVRLRLILSLRRVWFAAFTVADGGIGIPPDKQEAIFEAFEQADASTTRRFGGSGLGLAISRRLVGLMGGTIHVESPWKDEFGSSRPGSAFHFTALFEQASEATAVRRPLSTPRRDPGRCTSW